MHVKQLILCVIIVWTFNLSQRILIKGNKTHGAQEHMEELTSK